MVGQKNIFLLSNQWPPPQTGKGWGGVGSYSSFTLFAENGHNLLHLFNRSVSTGQFQPVSFNRSTADDVLQDDHAVAEPALLDQLQV